MTDEERASAQAWMGRAHAAVASATHLLAGGFHSDAVSRAYYAAFYAATALLETRGLRVSRHSAVLKLIGREFVLGGGLTADQGKRLNILFEERQRADYMSAPEVDDADVTGALQDAKVFVAAASALLDRIIAEQ